MATTPLHALLAAGGTAFEAGSDRPFLLGGDGAWLVDAGRLDVFSVVVRDGRPAGLRTHLCRVEAGRLALGGSTEDGVAGGARETALLAVGAAGTRLVPVHERLLRQLITEPQHVPELARLLEDWVDLIYSGLAAGLPPAGCLELLPGEHTLAAANPRLRPAGRVGWVRHEGGSSLLFGRPGLRVNGNAFTPVSSRAWLEAAAPGRLRVLDTEALLATGELWPALGHLHDLVLDCAAQLAQDALAAERERLRQKTAASHRAFSGAFARLVRTLDGPPAEEGAAPIDPAAADDPLFAACARVGAALALDVRPYAREKGRAAPRDPLAAIAQASRFRSRQVLLRDGWWRRDGGPFLAHLQADGRPVALIPTPATGYVLDDPVAGERTPITAELAAQVDPRAYAFYRPFPDAPVGLRELVRFGLHGCGHDLRMVVAMSVATGLLSLVPPLATGMIFDDIIPGAERGALLQITLGLLVIAAAMALFNVVSAIALVRTEGRMGASTQSALWDRLLSLPMPFFRPYSAGNLATRAMGLDAIRQVLSGATVTALIGGITSIFHFGLLFHYSPRLALWASLLIALAVAAASLTGRLQMGQERAVAEIQNKLAGSVLQFLSSISKLRVAGAEVQAFALWAAAFSRQRRRQYRSRTYANAFAAFDAGFPMAANLVLYALALPILARGDSLRTGDFLAFMTSFATCLTGTMAAATSVLNAILVVPLYEQARPILVAPPEVDRGKTDPGPLTGDIEIQRLRFRYQADGPTILRDITLHVRAGEFVAFVGPSGSGKSTILRLLLGFEAPESGAIYYDGQDLAGLDLHAVRRQIGVVLQGGRVMAGDIFTNIVGSSLATLDDAWEAARMAGLEADVRAMPMGMYTVVSEGGGTLSGGQRQRLMIARALVQRPRILFFDEATSALDNRTQEIVTTSLDRLKATRIVIAHRLSTILRADRIYVVHQGRIAESGSYQELLEGGALFAELARRQLA